MTTKKKILAISGSTRASSTNLNLIYAIVDLVSETLAVEIFNGLADLPHFNPDHDTDQPPAAVAAFRNMLRSKDGILICTPEYAMGVPGSLKNALDWTVSSMEFSHKPVALITASTLGEKGHASLLETLKVIESNITAETALLISHARTKIGKDNRITDAHTMQEIQHLLAAFVELL
jgi:NAD(P)H-dependent FMN reductase